VDVESDPELAGIKLIAEAWDAAGLYKVGSFIGDSWKEWNGRFRDDVRSFLRGENHSVRNFVDRLLGSPAIYSHEEREAEQSVNFVTCHDGFTLNDLVSYDHKHNEANGENNRDGSNDNRSWNCGVEGPTDDPGVEKLRNRQIKNLLTVTMLSVGLPMLLMGDELRRTQSGNNNAYCQDNEISWFDWTFLTKHADVCRFVSLLNARRVLRDQEPERHVIVNAYWESLDFELPQVDGLSENRWRRWIDTALDSPHDIVPWETAEPITAHIYRAESRSVVMLFRGV
jgi:glycogen operon protein